jgi:hypothetical protein
LGGLLNRKVFEMDWYHNTQFSDPEDEDNPKEGMYHKFIIELHGFSDVESIRRIIADAIPEQFLLSVSAVGNEEWRAELVSDDLFSAIITAENGSKLIAQCTSIEIANLITTSKRFLNWSKDLPDVVIPEGLESDMRDAIVKAKYAQQSVQRTCPLCLDEKYIPHGDGELFQKCPACNRASR